MGSRSARVYREDPTKYTGFNNFQLMRRGNGKPFTFQSEEHKAFISKADQLTNKNSFSAHFGLL